MIKIIFMLGANTESLHQTVCKFQSAGGRKNRMSGAKGGKKWEKYFKGKGNIKTYLKVDTTAVEFENPTKKVPLKEGTEIIVYSKSSYEQYDKKYLISLVNSKKRLLISGDDVEKPVVGDCDNIKPQHFGLKGSDPTRDCFSTTQIEAMVKSTLAGHKRDDLHDIVKKYLLFLAQAVKNNSKTTKFKGWPTIKKEQTYQKQIAKNFGEVLSGLVVIVNRDLFPKLDIKSTDKIFFPKEENYPLTDFMVVGEVAGKKKIKYQFSVKAEVGESKNTNTVKPEHIIKLIDKNPKFEDDWSKTTEYKIIKILAEGTTISGPLEAALELHKTKNLAPKEKSLTKERIKTTLIQYKKTKKLDAKGKETFHDAHQHVSSASKKMNYTMFFLDAINSKVYYIILSGFAEGGLPKWETIGDTTGKNQKTLKTVYLRYKDDQNKMGFQT